MGCLKLLDCGTVELFEPIDLDADNAEFDTKSGFPKGHPL
jgi:hypothetical protein